jgi:hypothetical protein
VGRDADASHGGQDGLRQIFVAPGIHIEGAGEVVCIPTDRGSEIFLAGLPIGWTSRPGDVLAREQLPAALAVRAAAGFESCRDSIEGRFVLFVRRPDGTWEFGADRFGQVDLYMQRRDSQVIYATDLSLLPVVGDVAGYDQVGLAHTLTVFGWRPAKRHTLYRDVQRLGVGEYVVAQAGQAEVRSSPFRALPTGEYGQRELEEYTELLLDAVRVRASNSGNVVYLSSGWDSTAILACLVKLFGRRKVRAVIGRMRYSDRSGVINQFEIDRANAIAAYYGVPLETVEFDNRREAPELFDSLRPMLRANQISGPVILNHWRLANAVRATTTFGEAVFAGEISDGAHNLGFAQYFTIFHPVQEFRQYSDKMASYLFGPTFLRSFEQGGFADDVVFQILRSRTPGEFDSPAPETGTARRRQLLASFFLRANRMPLWSLRNSRILTEDGARDYEEEMGRVYLTEAAEALTPDTLYSWFLHLYNSFHWQGSTVATLPLSAEAHDVQVQLPFWDSRLQEFLSRMPESFGRGLDLNPTKYPLKWALANRIDYPMHLQAGPHSYVYDVQPTFSLAGELLYASGFADYFRSRLRNRAYRQVLDDRSFRLDYLDAVIDRYLAGDEVEGAELNDLISICWLFAVGCYGAD